MLKNNYIYVLFALFVFLFSCQQKKNLEKVVFDYDQLAKINLNASQLNLNLYYEPKFVEPYIDHSLLNTPSDILIGWIENNIKFFGNNNNFVINIIDASLKKSEIPNISAKKYEEQTIFYYELTFLTEFILYDDTNNILANSIVESKNTTTSGKFISLYESERIIDLLIFDSLEDFTKEAGKLITKHMHNFVL